MSSATGAKTSAWTEANDSGAPALRATVLGTAAEGRLYQRLRLTRPPELGYARPGQYVAMLPCAAIGQVGARYFVLASEVDESEYIEFIIKKEGDTALLLTALAAGAEVALTAAQGAGFAVERAAGRELVCFASGSGIAGIIPLVAWVTGQPSLQVRRVWVYYGETASTDFAFDAELTAMRARGVEVALSSANDPETTAGRRFVQEAFAAHGPELTEATVIICGSSKMQQSIEALMASRGLDPTEALRNY